MSWNGYSEGCWEVLSQPGNAFVILTKEDCQPGYVLKDLPALHRCLNSMCKDGTIIAPVIVDKVGKNDSTTAALFR